MVLQHLPLTLEQLKQYPQGIYRAGREKMPRYGILACSNGREAMVDFSPSFLALQDVPAKVAISCTNHMKMERLIYFFVLECNATAKNSCSGGHKNLSIAFIKLKQS